VLLPTPERPLISSSSVNGAGTMTRLSTSH
jgi:hypothetical protein